MCTNFGIHRTLLKLRPCVFFATAGTELGRGIAELGQALGRLPELLELSMEHNLLGSQ